MLLWLFLDPWTLASGEIQQHVLEMLEWVKGYSVRHLDQHLNAWDLTGFLKKLPPNHKDKNCALDKEAFGCVLKQWKCVAFIFICIYQSVCRYCHNTSDAAYINTTMAFECTICLVYKQFTFLLSCILKCALLICIYSLHYRSVAYYAQYSCQPIATVYLHNKQDKWHFECWLLTLLHTLTL